MQGRTWWVTPAAGTTIGMAAAMLALGLCLVELAARAGIGGAVLPPPSYGGRSVMLEAQIENLRLYGASRGGVDCIFLGNSLALYGFDPEAFASVRGAGDDRTGGCFNFAVPGTTAVDAAVLARVLASAYEPTTLIYGVSVRDLAVAAAGPDLDSMAWVRYRLGTFSTEGLLADRSHAYRRYLGWRNAARWTHPPRYVAELRSDGYVASDRSEVDSRRERARADRTVRPYIAQGISERQVGAVAELASLQEFYETIVVVELPLHREALGWFASQGNFYEKGIEMIAGAASANGVPFLRPPSGPPLPPDGWGDWWHLNRRGAAAFSRWLGERVPIPLAAAPDHAA